MRENSVIDTLNKAKKDLIASTGAILVLIAVLAILCSNFSYTQFAKPTLLSNYTVTSDSASNKVSIYIDIEHEMLGNIIAFYTNDSFVDAYIDDEQIYHYGDTSSICRSPGSLYQMIQIPEHHELIGKKLRIDINTVYKQKFTDKYDIYLSSSGGWITTKLKEEVLDIIINIIIFMLGLILCIVYVLERKNGTKNISTLYLGCAAVLTAIWTSCELFLFQLILPTGIGQYFIYYCSFMVLPMLLMLYFENMYDKEVKYTAELYSHFTFTVVMILLQFSGISEFTETILLYLIVCIVELVSVVLKSLIYKSKYGTKYMTHGLIILVGCIIANSVTYMLDTTKHASLVLTKIGFVVYIIVALYGSFEHLMVSVIYADETRKLSKIAYTDFLTKIGNRYAFDRDIETISIEYVSLISIDINNLKYFNDTYGHLCGDSLIIEATNILKKCFSGSIYRTGGDEFIVIQAGTSEEKIQKEIDKVHEMSKKFNEKTSTELIIEIACGCSEYKTGDNSYEDILKRADKQMYKDKQRLKDESPIKYERDK